MNIQALSHPLLWFLKMLDFIGQKQILCWLHGDNEKERVSKSLKNVLMSNRLPTERLFLVGLNLFIFYRSVAQTICLLRGYFYVFTDLCTYLPAYLPTSVSLANQSRKALFPKRWGWSMGGISVIHLSSSSSSATICCVSFRTEQRVTVHGPHSHMHCTHISIQADTCDIRT